MEQISTIFHIRHFLFNKALRILLVTNAMILLAVYMLGPIYALFVEKVGGDLLDASFAGGVLALVAGITVLISGKYTDRINRPERVVAFGYVLIGTGFISYIFVNSIWFLLTVQVVVGLGEAIYSPAFDAVYSKHLSGQKSGAEWGVWESLNYFSSAAGAVLGGFIVTYLGFNTLFLIMSSLCFVSAIYIFHLPKQTL